MSLKRPHSGYLPFTMKLVSWNGFVNSLSENQCMILDKQCAPPTAYAVIVPIGKGSGLDFTVDTCNCFYFPSLSVLTFESKANEWWSGEDADWVEATTSWRGSGLTDTVGRTCLARICDSCMILAADRSMQSSRIRQRRAPLHKQSNFEFDTFSVLGKSFSLSLSGPQRPP